jgi:hypothetical protein
MLELPQPKVFPDFRLRAAKDLLYVVMQIGQRQQIQSIEIPEMVGPDIDCEVESGRFDCGSDRQLVERYSTCITQLKYSLGWRLPFDDGHARLD